MRLLLSGLWTPNIDPGAHGWVYKTLRGLLDFLISLQTDPACATAMGRFPWAEVILFEVLHIIVFYPTRQHVYRVVVFAAMIYLAAQIYSTLEVPHPLTLPYNVGFTIASHLAFTAYIMFTEGSFPDHWRRVRDEVHTKADAGGLDKLPSKLPSAKKIWWMVDLAYSVRMVGWVQQPRDCLPPPPPPSRRPFLWKTFLKLIANAVIIDLSMSINAQNPAFDSRVHDPTDGPETYLAALPFMRRVPYTVLYGMGVGASMVAAHSVVALVCVGLGYSSPTLWPHIWGRWGDGYTLRKLWGYVR